MCLISMMIGKIMSIMQIIKIVFRQLLKPLAGRLPNQRDSQNFSGTMISASGTAKTSAGRQFPPAGRRKTQRGEWGRAFAIYQSFPIADISYFRGIYTTVIVET